METLIILKDFFKEYGVVLLPIIYELIVRLKPTAKNWSVLSLIMKLLNATVPNKSKTGGTFLLIFAVLISVSSFAQLNGNFKSVRFRPAQDTTTFSPKPQGTVTRHTDGNLYIVNSAGFWESLGGGGGGGNPAGNDREIQYNNAGSFGGVTDLTFKTSMPISGGAGLEFENSKPFRSSITGGTIYTQITSGNLTFRNPSGTPQTTQTITSNNSGNWLTVSANELNIDTNSQIGIVDGANKSMGIATLVAGTVTVNNTRVEANSRIFLTCQAVGGTVGTWYISARVVGTSFTITSTSGADTSSIAWLIISPN